MSDIQKEIKEALQAYNLRGDSQDIRIMQNNAPTWLFHQQELIEQLQREHFQICTKLGYAQKELARLTDQLEYSKLTPMQKLSRSMDILSQFEKEGM